MDRKFGNKNIRGTNFDKGYWFRKMKKPQETKYVWINYVQTLSEIGNAEYVIITKWNCQFILMNQQKTMNYKARTLPWTDFEQIKHFVRDSDDFFDCKNDCKTLFDIFSAVLPSFANLNKKSQPLAQLIWVMNNVFEWINWVFSSQIGVLALFLLVFSRQCHRLDVLRNSRKPFAFH